MFNANLNNWFLAIRPKTLPATLALLGIPAAFLSMALYLKSGLGPYWLGSNSDPSYSYLMEGLNLLFGYPTRHIHHPGTTLQLLSAMVIRLAAGPRSPDDLLFHIFSNPEYYLNKLFLVLLTFDMISIILLGWFVYKKTDNILMAIVAQLPSLILLTVQSAGLPVVLDISPENLCIALSNVYAVLLLSVFFSSDRKTKIPLALFIGATAAVGLVTKVTFIPMVLAGFVLIKGFIPRIYASFSFIITVTVVTIPIHKRYHDFQQWIYEALIDLGTHGSAKETISNFLHNVWGLLYSNIGWLIMLLAGTGFFIFGCLQLFRGHKIDKDVFWFQGVCLGAILLQCALVASRSMDIHYAVPVIILAGVIWLAAGSFFPKRWWRRLSAILILFILFSSFYKVFSYQPRLAKRKKNLLSFSEKIREYENHCLIIPYYRSSGQKYAVILGLYAYPPTEYGRYLATLKKIYKNPFALNFWSMNIHDFQSNYFFSPMYRQMKERAACVLFQGSQPLNPEIISSTPILSSAGKEESLYLITEK